MSPDNGKIFYCVPTMQDGLRHTPKALNEDLEYLLYGEGVKDLFRILNGLFSKKTILLNGFRFCDRCIARIGLYLGCKVIILQHGRNEYFASRGPLAILNKPFIDPRYGYEFLFLLVASLWFCVIRLKRRRLDEKSFCNLLYFTDSYKDLWVKSLENLNVELVDTKVNAPNPTTWGTVIPISRIDSLPTFLVDEPLDITIGMSNERYLKLIDELSIKLGIDKIYTRRHPRSDVEKFKKTLNIIEIEEVPENVQVLIGYKSNLLFCGINAEKFYQFDLGSLKAVNPSILQDTLSQELRDYSNLTKEAFLCD